MVVINYTFGGMNSHLLFMFGYKFSQETKSIGLHVGSTKPFANIISMFY